MRKLPWILSLLMVMKSAYADPLTDQIYAVKRAQEQQAREQEAARIRQEEAQGRYEEARQAEIRNKERAREAEARRVAEQEKGKSDVVARDKKRDQDYQDKLRDIDIQERALRLDAEKVRVARENEFIDQDLKARAATTDVVQSHADAARNISQGAKTLMEKTGEAEVKKESGLFGK